MKGYRPEHSFDSCTAADYVDLKRGDEEAAVRFLRKRARDGPALEWAIGTGRIALPLAATGIPVDGNDISPHMIEKLRTQPGGEDINIVMGSFVDTVMPRRYSLIYVVFNTLFNILSQEEQIRCFENAAAHLTSDGLFIVEAFTPAFLYRLQDNQYVQAEAIEVNQVQLDVLRHDAAKQMLEENHVTLSERGVRFNPVAQRYAWPAELDLMARIAGLRLKERFGSWNEEVFTSSSDNCISVYGDRAKMLRTITKAD